MEHEIMLIQRRDGWHIDIDSIEPKGYPLLDKDFVYAKAEAKKYVRKLNLEKITVIDKLSFESKIYLD